ncbi:MAG: flagellar hook-basal body complex protein FliE [Solirubrobacteraceae bacterium]|nr:flagellar hook-basal body complex protein FliE [Solirubrobacteraceae bacterium]
MTIPPIDTSFVTTGPEWQVDAIAPTPAEIEAGAGPDAVGAPSGASFGELLGDSLRSLQARQDEAARAAQALATGQAGDPTSVVMAIEKAQLAMQLASTIRTKAVESFNDVFRTTV